MPITIISAMMDVWPTIIWEHQVDESDVVEIRVEPCIIYLLTRCRCRKKGDLLVFACHLQGLLESECTLPSFINSAYITI